jgi:phage baseplate assembly protein W
MAYQVIDISDFTTNNTVLPLGISFKDTTSLLPAVYDIARQIQENISDVLSTYPGERVGDWITYGCRLREIIFEPNVNNLKSEISEMIVDAFSSWIPSNVDLTSIDITTAEDNPNLQNLIEIKIKYIINGTINGSVTVSGTESGNLTVTG